LFQKAQCDEIKLSLLLAVPAVVVAFVLFNKACGLLRHNPVIELAADRGYFFPEELVPGQWVFWCMSRDPGINSGATHLAAADYFADKKGLKYLGPREVQHDWSGWPLIFVTPDGAYKVIGIYGFDFNLYGENPITTLCWENGKAVISINADRTLQVSERK
jgi:hypothetical protein